MLAPQRHALFRHLNLQKWSEPFVFWTFWLRNVLRAATACHLPRRLRTHRFCLLFHPPEPPIIGKTQCFANFLLFRAPDLFSSDFIPSLIFFLLFFSLTLPTSAFSSVHIVGSLTSKFPSIIYQPYDKLKNAGWFFWEGTPKLWILKRSRIGGLLPFFWGQVINHCSCGWPWLEPLASQSPCRLCWSYAPWQGWHPLWVSCNSSFFSGWFLRSISKMGLRVLDFDPYMFQCIQTEAKCTEKVTKMISGHWEILVKASLTFDVSAALMGGIWMCPSWWFQMYIIYIYVYIYICSTVATIELGWWSTTHHRGEWFISFLYPNDIPILWLQNLS